MTLVPFKFDERDALRRYRALADEEEFARYLATIPSFGRHASLSVEADNKHRKPGDVIRKMG